MTRLDASRWPTALGLTLALLAWSAESRSTEEPRVDPSSQPDAVAIGSVPKMLVTTSDRPVPSPHSRLDEGQRGLGLMAMTVANIVAPASALGSVRLSPSVFSAGPVALGLAGRGPPSSGNV